LHRQEALDYAGSAVDPKTRDIGSGDLNAVVARIRECVGEDFEAVLEIDLIHIKFQPRKPL
jgi:hypothetical protein